MTNNCNCFCFSCLNSGESFPGTPSGMAIPETVCKGANAVGLSTDINPFEPHLVAGTMAHMIGHNIGMGHDDGRNYNFNLVRLRI